MKFTNKNLIIFDLDGTLIDSVPDLASAINNMLKKINRDIFKVDIIRGWVGDGASVLVKRALLGKIDISSFVEDNLYKNALEIFLSFYKQNLCIDTILYDGVENTLKKLKNDGYKLVIITNKPYEFIEPILKYFDILDLFTFYLGANSLEKKKPDSMPLLYVADKFNINIENCIMVGDSKNDIISANSAKMDSIAVSYGYNYEIDINLYNPTIKIDNFTDILKVLGN